MYGRSGQSVQAGALVADMLENAVGTISPVGVTAGGGVAGVGSA